MTDDLFGERGPARRPKAARPAEREQRDNKRTAAEKLARRLAGLPAGRYELVLTVGEDGVLADWSVRWFGKVEQP